MAAGDPTASKVKAGDKVAVHQSLTGLFDRGTRAGAVTPPPPPTEPTGEEAGPLLPPTDPPTVLSVAQKVGFCVVGVALIAGLVVATTATLDRGDGGAGAVLHGLQPHETGHDQQGPQPPTPGDGGCDPATGWRTACCPSTPSCSPSITRPPCCTQLVDGILSLDYPEDRLDVKLLVEADDDETREAATALVLPDCFEILVVPDVGPTGKPRACNHGLVHARGEYLVIYDAEDRPEADQLRKSVLAFTKAEPEVVCLQAQLNYFNRTPQPVHPVVHRRVLGVVRPVPARPAGHGRGDPARRHLQPLHHGQRLADWVGGTPSM